MSWCQWYQWPGTNRRERREIEKPAGGTHNSALCPNAERGREKKIQCNILFGINTLSLLQEHLI